ncbi:MAG: diguanylate cyclase [Deltaproteobacteria bacterium]|nr:diguanylate cyclase [Deltaproteobacteria bacterium]MBW2496444.1 diguanylate cyclase [Deltaproteobacteria bacterium]
MGRLTPVIRISAGLVLVTSSVLVLLDMLGLTPIPKDTALQARVRLCETIAAQAVSAAERSDLSSIRTTLQLTTERNEDILSAGLRDRQGRLLVATPQHRTLWNPDEDAQAPTTHVHMPLFKRGQHWGDVELRFTPLHPDGFWAALWARPIVRLISVLGVAGFIAYLVYMRRTLQYLDPSAVIPTRVQAALDVMAEGVMLVDPRGRIVLANAALGELLGRPAKGLLGLEASRISWQTREGRVATRLPWTQAMRDAEPAPESSIYLREEGRERSLIVKAAPVIDAHGRAKGAIATFDDVTELEEKSAELERALIALEKTQDEIRLQNEELQVLAKRDPLTGVSNRRFFLEHAEREFERARIDDTSLSCIMADLDDFKSINDTHGHLEGDDVIRRVAEVLKAEVRETDWICRYGGEEFCIALRGVDADQALVIAERMRSRVSAPAFARVPITVSLGVSAMEFGAKSFEAMIREADEALYASKQAGRDCVTRWDECR